MKIRKHIFITVLVALLIFFNVQAQIGIGTTNPQQDLHISGDGTETIRVDGLNASTITNNFGSNTSLPIHINASGDMIIPSSPATSELTFSGQDLISSPINLKTGTVGQSSGAVELFRTPSFTLTQPAIVMITYGMSISVLDINAINPVFDGKPKLINNFFYIGNGTTPDTSTKYGTYTQNYSNFSFYGTQWITTNGYYNNNVDTIYLPAGTYSVHLNGSVVSNTGNPPFNSSDSFSVNFGGDSEEYLKIITLY